MTVSIVLPIYKVKPFIERCVRSLMEQTYKDIEFILVDDASPDESTEIARQVVAGYDRNVQFITHSENKGLPAARNTGLKAATGEFVYHCDSDDWLEPDMIGKMVDAATKNDADFVYCDFFLSFTDKERYMSQPGFTDKFEALQQGMLTGRMKHNVWNKLIRRRLYFDNGIQSPEDHNKGGEDYMIIKLLRAANRIAHVPEALYHYNRTNVNAITKKSSSKHFEDIKANADDAISFLTSHPIPDPTFLQFFKLDIKLPFLMERDRESVERWRTWYPEANAYISKDIYLPTRIRFVQCLAKWNLFPLVHLYSWAVEHLYYKFMYR